jgi:hypothetical protein
MAILAPLFLIFSGEIGAWLAGSSVSRPIFLALTVPYTAFAVLCIVIMRKFPPGALRDFSYRAPIVFLFIQTGYFMLSFWTNASVVKDLVGLGGIAVFIGTYIMILGYLYVFISEQAYLSYLFHQRSKHREKYRASVAEGKLRC